MILEYKNGTKPKAIYYNDSGSYPDDYDKDILTDWDGHDNHIHITWE